MCIKASKNRQLDLTDLDSVSSPGLNANTFCIMAGSCLGLLSATMPPRNVDIDLCSSAEVKENEVEPVVTEETVEQKRPPMKIVWKNVIIFSFLHLAALYGMFLLPWAKPQTWLFSKYTIVYTAYLVFVLYHCI